MHGKDDVSAPRPGTLIKGPKGRVIDLSLRRNQPLTWSQEPGFTHAPILDPHRQGNIAAGRDIALTPPENYGYPVHASHAMPRFAPIVKPLRSPSLAGRTQYGTPLPRTVPSRPPIMDATARGKGLDFGQLFSRVQQLQALGADTHTIQQASHDTFHTGRTIHPLWETGPSPDLVDAFRNRDAGRIHQIVSDPNHLSDAYHAAMAGKEAGFDPSQIPPATLKAIGRALADVAGTGVHLDGRVPNVTIPGFDARTLRGIAAQRHRSAPKNANPVQLYDAAFGPQQNDVVQFATNLGNDVRQSAEGLPMGAALTGQAAWDAAHGNYKPAEQIGSQAAHDFGEMVRHPGHALFTRPFSTLTAFTGVGKGLGEVGKLGLAAKLGAAADRPALRLTSLAGEHGAPNMPGVAANVPELPRVPYSKNLVDYAAQRVSDAAHARSPALQERAMRADIGHTLERTKHQMYGERNDIFHGLRAAGKGLNPQERQAALARVAGETPERLAEYHLAQADVADQRLAKATDAARQRQLLDMADQHRAQASHWARVAAGTQKRANPAGVEAFAKAWQDAQHGNDALQIRDVGLPANSVLGRPFQLQRLVAQRLGPAATSPAMTPELRALEAETRGMGGDIAQAQQVRAEANKVIRGMPRAQRTPQRVESALRKAGWDDARVAEYHATTPQIRDFQQRKAAIGAGRTLNPAAYLSQSGKAGRYGDFLYRNLPDYNLRGRLDGAQKRSTGVNFARGGMRWDEQKFLGNLAHIPMLAGGKQTLTDFLDRYATPLEGAGLGFDPATHVIINPSKIGQIGHHATGDIRQHLAALAENSDPATIQRLLMNRSESPHDRAFMVPRAAWDEYLKRQGSDVSAKYRAPLKWIDSWKRLSLKRRPGWAINNMIQNPQLAALEGVGPLSHARALGLNRLDPRARLVGEQPIDYREFIPESIARNQGMVGGIVDEHLGVASKTPTGRLHNAVSAAGHRLGQVPLSPEVAGRQLRLKHLDPASVLVPANLAAENEARAATYLRFAIPEARRMAKAEGISLPEALQRLKVHEDATHGPITQRVEKALGHFGGKPNAALGAAVPFYRWDSFMAKRMLADMPTRTPLRAAALQEAGHQGDEKLNPMGRLLGWEGSIPFGQSFQSVVPGGPKRHLTALLATRNLNNFSTVSDLLPLDPLTGEADTEGAQNSVQGLLNPYAQLAIKGLTGWGANDYDRVHGVGSMGMQLLQSFPQASLVPDLRPGGQSKKFPQPKATEAQNILRYLLGVSVRSKDLETAMAQNWKKHHDLLFGTHGSPGRDKRADLEAIVRAIAAERR